VHPPVPAHMSAGPVPPFVTTSSNYSRHEKPWTKLAYCHRRRFARGLWPGKQCRAVLWNLEEQARCLHFRRVYLTFWTIALDPKTSPADVAQACKLTRDLDDY
jgi:hypothetical protein